MVRGPRTAMKSGPRSPPLEKALAQKRRPNTAKNKEIKIKNVKKKKEVLQLDFPGGAVVKNPPANAGDTGSSPAPGKFHMPQSN